MNTTDYVRNMLKYNKEIYIDTASLMEIEGMKNFIENYEYIFMECNRKICVSKAVYLELTRHLKSDNFKKANKAFIAMDMLENHKGLFEIEKSNITEIEIIKAFADSELLARLTINKKEFGQLLITNDRSLSEDAYELNSLASCKGRRVMVCYINSLGNLQKCSCANTDNQNLENHKIATDKSNTKTIITDKSEGEKDTENHAKYILPIVSGATCFLLGKYSSNICAFTKRTMLGGC